MIHTRHCRLLLLFCSSLLFSLKVPGQFKNYNTENEYWSPGAIQLIDKETIEGELNYNFVSQTLRIRRSDQIETFNAREVLLFNLIQEDGNRKTFYSLPYKDEAFDRERPVFFYVIYEGKGIALLSRNVLEFRNTQLSDDPAAAFYILPTANKVESIKEVIYLANALGSIKPYLEGKKSTDFNFTPTYRSYPTASSDGNYKLEHDEKKFEESQLENKVRKFKVVDKRLLSESLGSDFYKVEDFMKENNVKSNTVEGLVRIMDYYSENKDQ